MQVKEGVEVEGVHDLLAYAAEVFEALHLHLGLGEVWITGGTEPAPGRVRNTLHRHGLALDMRSSSIPVQWRGPFAAYLRRLLGPGFDVVLERDHVHIEASRALLRLLQEVSP